MAKSWPVDTFIEHLRALMDREGIPDYAELSRLSGVSQTQFSNWKKGTHQPSQESLDKIAPVLHVTQASLYIAAGILSPGHLDAPEDYDPTILPREFLDLIELYTGASEHGQQTIRDHIAFAVRGLGVLLSDTEEIELTRRPQRKRAG